MRDGPDPSRDLAVVLDANREALTVIEDHDPDRNPARFMRQLRRVYDNPNLRNAVKRLGH
jgi:hypothetical protein